mgnify:CR=1 FL=1
MFNTFSKRKIILVGVALLIVAAGVLIMSRSGSFSGGSALVAQAWQAAFGGPETDGLAVDLPSPSSSTISDTVGQENASLERSAAWPSLLIDPKSPKGSPDPSTSASRASISRDLEIALDKALADAGLA